ncbi:helix-turn-helix domain-containing protein [Streptomyces sp. NPDC002680]|uniref:helix-turn-helix domain-containing protein n=1 Tax=Streptomyces sp. NPDC002680 TaxID=3364659 RepID=UPI0036CFCC61
MDALQTEDFAKVAFSDEERAYARAVVSTVRHVVPGLARAFVPPATVVLYDLTESVDSPVTVAGGEVLGLDTSLSSALAGEETIGARRMLESGRVVRSSRLLFRAAGGRAVAALCIEADISDFARAHEILAAMTPAAPGPSTEASADRERFARSVESLAQDILRETIEAVGVSVELMKKTHKMRAVRELDRRGFFALRESIDIAAQALGVTRFSIYKYINEVRAEEGTPQP